MKKMLLFTLMLTLIFSTINLVPAYAQSPKIPHGHQFEFLQNPPKASITDPVKIKERHKWIQEQVAEIFEKTHDSTAVEAFFSKDNGFISVPLKKPRKSEQVFSIQSDGSTNVTMSTPIISYDSITGEYIFQGSMQWKTQSDSCSTPYWYNDISAEGNVGGYDEMGIWLNTSTNMMLTDHILETFYKYPSRAGHGATIVTQPYDWYSGGVVFQNQDQAQYDFVSSTCPTQNWDYSWDGAYILMYIKLTAPKTGTYELHSQVGHSWESTTITSLGVSTSGVNVSWSPSYYGWDIESGATYWSL